MKLVPPKSTCVYLVARWSAGVWRRPEDPCPRRRDRRRADQRQRSVSAERARDRLVRPDRL